MPEELGMEVRDIVQEAVITVIPKQNKCQKDKWLSEKALQIADKWREAKGKGYICLYKIYSYAAAAKQQLCFSCVWLCATP